MSRVSLSSTSTDVLVHVHKLDNKKPVTTPVTTPTQPPPLPSSSSCTPPKTRSRVCISITCNIFLISLVAYGLYAVWQLNKLSELKVVIRSATIESLCTRDIQYIADIDFESESKIGLGVETVHLAFRSQANSAAFATTSFQPQFVFGSEGRKSNVIRLGSNEMKLNGNVSIVNIAAAADALSQLLSEGAALVLVDFNASVSLDPVLWMPISVPVSGTFKHILTSTISSEISSAVAFANETEGWMAQLRWTLRHLDNSIDLNVTVPQLHLAIFSDNMHIGRLTSSPFNFSKHTNHLENMVEVPTATSAAHAKVLRGVFNDFTHAIDCSFLRVSGSREKPESSCMLQQVLDAMPFTRIGKRQIISHPSSKGFAPSFLNVSEVKVDAFSRPRPGHLSSSIRIDSSLNTPFPITARMPSLHLDLLANDERVGNVELQRFQMQSGEQSELRLDVLLTNVGFLVNPIKQMLKGQRMKLPNMTLRSRGGENLNVWSPMLDFLQFANGTGANQTAFVQPKVGLAFEVKEVDGDALQVNASVSLAGFPFIGVDIALPAFSGDCIHADMALLHVEVDSIVIPADGGKLQHSLSATISRAKARHLGSVISAFVAGAELDLALRSSNLTTDSLSLDFPLGTVSLQRLSAESLLDDFRLWSVSDLVALGAGLNKDTISLSAETQVQFTGLPAVEVSFGGILPSFTVEFFEESKMDSLGFVHVLPTAFGRGRFLRIEAEGSFAHESWELLRVSERVLIKGRPSSRSSVWNFLLTGCEFSFRQSEKRTALSATPFEVSARSDSSSLSLSVSTTVTSYPFVFPLVFDLRPGRVQLFDERRREFIDAGSVALGPTQLRKGVECMLSLQLTFSSKNNMEHQKLARTLGAFLNGKTNLAVKFVATRRSIVSAFPFDAWFNLSASSVGPQEGASGNDAAESPLFSVSMTKVNLLGSDVPGRSIQIPCLLRGHLCPRELHQASGSGLRVQLLVDITTDFLSTPVLISTPSVSALVEYGLSSPLMSVEMSGLDLQLPTTSSSAPVRAALEFTLRPQSFEVIGAAIDAWMEPQVELLTFSLHGQAAGRGVNFLSTLLTEVDLRLFLPAQNNLTSEENGRFDYFLNSSTETSATIRASYQTDITLPLDLNLGQVELDVLYEDVVIASIDTEVRIGPVKPLYLDLDVEIVGQDTISSANVPDGINVSPKLYRLNKFFSDLSKNAFESGGTQATMQLFFRNVHGQREMAEMHFVLFEKKHILTDDILENLPAPLVNDFVVEFKDADMKFVQGSMESYFDLPGRLFISNPPDLSVRTERVSMAVVICGKHTINNDVIESCLQLERPVDPSSSDGFLDADMNAFNFNLPINDSEIERKGWGDWDIFEIEESICIDLAAVSANVILQVPGGAPLQLWQQLLRSEDSIRSNQKCMKAPTCMAEIVGVKQLTLGNFSDPEQTNLLDLTETAKLTCGELSLVSKVGERSACFFKLQANVEQSFTFEFEFSTDISISTEEIAFVLQSTNSRSEGIGKGNILYETPSLTLAFHSEKFVTSIVLRMGDKVLRTVDMLCDEYDPACQQDSRFVEFSYCKTSKRIDLFLQDQHIFALPIDMEELGFDNGIAWVGIAAADLSSAGVKQRVLHMSLSRPRPEVSMFELREHGRVLSKVGEAGTFTILSRDSCGFPLEMDSFPEIEVRLQHVWRKRVRLELSDEVESNGDGSALVSFIIKQSGTYSVDIRESSENEQNAWTHLGSITIEPL